MNKLKEKIVDFAKSEIRKADNIRLQEERRRKQAEKDMMADQKNHSATNSPTKNDSDGGWDKGTIKAPSSFEE